MNMIRYKPFGVRNDHPFRSLIDEMNQLFEGYPSTSLSSAADFVPALDVTESDKAFTVKIELAGMDDKDIDLSIKDGVLTVRGEKKSETRDEQDNFVRVERSFGSFHRSISIPSNVEEKSVKANFEKGLLTVILPKVDEEKSTHKIKIDSK